jgi:hypothetical protein
MLLVFVVPRAEKSAIFRVFYAFPYPGVDGIFGRFAAFWR